MANKTVSQLIESDGPGYDDIIEISQVSQAITISATTISAQASDNSFNDSANGFVSAGFTSGDHVKVLGFTGDNANNIFTGEITDLTAGKMTVGGSDGDVIVDDAAGETVTISKWVTRRAPRYGKVLLQEITLSLAGEFDFDDIPAGFNRLIIEGAIKSTRAVTRGATNIAFNADTTVTNYNVNILRSSNGMAEISEGNTNNLSSVNGSQTPGLAAEFTHIRSRIEQYNNPAINKMVLTDSAGLSATGNITNGTWATQWGNDDPINRIQISESNFPTEGLLGTLRLYGEL